MATWSEWETAADPGFEQRYVESIEVDGVLWTADGPDLVATDGRRARNEVLGELRLAAGYDKDGDGYAVPCEGELTELPSESWTIYGADGTDVEGSPDPEYRIEEQIRHEFGSPGLE